MKPIIKATAVFFVLSFIIACNKSGGDDPDSLDDFYIPDFSNNWTVAKGNTDGLIFLKLADVDSTKGTGTFAGDDQNGLHSYKVNGSFKNVDVTLNYLTNEENNGDNGPNAGISYAGKYDTLSTPYHIRMVNTRVAGDSLVLTHG